MRAQPLIPPPSPPLSRRGELWEREGAGSGSRGWPLLSRLRPFVVHIHLGVLLVLLSSYHVRKS